MVLIAAFAVALMATPAAMWLARRTGLLDRPGDLKIQTTPVPYLGGLGVAAGLAVGIVPSRPALLLPLGLALLIGVIDDARHIRPITRLAAEVVVGLTAAAVVPVRLPGLLAVTAVTLVLIVVVNGVNMLDGLDGLAAGTALLSAVGFAVVLDGAGRTAALALAGSLGAFLVFNRPPAKVYLGDGGAYLVGATLAVLLLLAWSPDRPFALSTGVLLLLVCPVAELGFTLVRRMRSGCGLLAGDRSHIYDQLVDRGWPRNSAVGAYIAVQAGLVAVAIGAVRFHAAVAAGLAAACGLALLAAVAAFGFLTPTHPETAA